MDNKINAFVYWIPRVVSILFIVFLALFSLDVFGQGYSFWETVVGLFMHNIPSLILLVVLIISWKREIVGGVAFIAAGLLYVTMILKNALTNPFEWYMLSYSVIIAGPAFAIGILFMMNWRQKNRNRVRLPGKP